MDPHRNQHQLVASAFALSVYKTAVAVLSWFPPDGDPYEIRTRVAGVRGRSLRPLDQRAIYILNAFAVKPFLCTVSDAQFGAPSGTRTRDTLIKSQVLYQLS